MNKGVPYGDDPEDQHWIIEGWNDYKNGLYGAPRKPRGFGLIPIASKTYSKYLQKPLNYCSSKTQCW